MTYDPIKLKNAIYVCIVVVTTWSKFIVKKLSQSKKKFPSILWNNETRRSLQCSQEASARLYTVPPESNPHPRPISFRSIEIAYFIWAQKLQIKNCSVGVVNTLSWCWKYHTNSNLRELSVKVLKYPSRYRYIRSVSELHTLFERRMVFRFQNKYSLYGHGHFGTADCQFQHANFVCLTSYRTHLPCLNIFTCMT
jgi:hypothetical protein